MSRPKPPPDGQLTLSLLADLTPLGDGTFKLTPRPVSSDLDTWVTVRDAAGSRTLTDVVPNRFWTRTEVTAAARLAGGFTEAACYGDFSGGVSPSEPEAWRMIIVLRRL